MSQNLLDVPQTPGTHEVLWARHSPLPLGRAGLAQKESNRMQKYLFLDFFFFWQSINKYAEIILVPHRLKGCSWCGHRLSPCYFPPCSLHSRPGRTVCCPRHDLDSLLRLLTCCLWVKCSLPQDTWERDCCLVNHVSVSASQMALIACADPTEEWRLPGAHGSIRSFTCPGRAGERRTIQDRSLSTNNHHGHSESWNLSEKT